MGAGIFPTMNAFQINNTFLGLCCFTNTLIWICILVASASLFNDVKTLDFNFSIFIHKNTLTTFSSPNHDRNNECDISSPRNMKI